MGSREREGGGGSVRFGQGLSWSPSSVPQSALPSLRDSTGLGVPGRLVLGCTVCTRGAVNICGGGAVNWQGDWRGTSRVAGRFEPPSPTEACLTENGRYELIRRNLHRPLTGVNSKAFHTSPMGHTSEHHQWAGGHHSVVGTHLRRQRRKCLRRWRRKIRGGKFRRLL